MAPIPKRGLVAVTGAAGFLGGWTVKLLLDNGYRVRACVRNVDDEARTGFLKAMPGYASGRLTLHAADLDNPGCLDEVLPGCHGLAHIAHVSDYADQDYVARTCAHIIESVNKSQTVTRVVVTSSVAAVISEMDLNEIRRRPVFNEDRYPDELNPRRTPERGQGYSMAKLVAERAFADAAEESDFWDSVTVCPGDNVGPILSAHQRGRNTGPWQSLIARMLEGECMQNGVYRPWMTVDVRDDAECHVRLLETGEVGNGERFIAWSTDARKVEDICADIDRLLPELNHAPATLIDPQNDRIKEREAEFRSIWALADLRNDRMRGATGVEFRPLDDSIRDCVESLIAVAGVQVKRRETSAAVAAA
jgi:bifunctional dihydroflavonol 4-reductase/flavanone 4-reductase